MGGGEAGWSRPCWASPRWPPDRWPRSDRPRRTPPRLLDATPQLDLGFAAARLPVGAPGTLTFTVTDTAELAAKNGWSFTAQLPAGLVLDGASAATGCGSGTATVDAARGTVTVHGDLAAGQQACTATVRLTSVTGGTYQVCGSAITARVGVDLPGCASVTFDAPVFDARSHGVRLTSPLVGIGPLAASAHSCTSLPGEDGRTVLGAGLGGVGTLGVLTPPPHRPSSRSAPPALHRAGAVRPGRRSRRRLRPRHPAGRPGPPAASGDGGPVAGGAPVSRGQASRCSTAASKSRKRHSCSHSCSALGLAASRASQPALGWAPPSSSAAHSGAGSKWSRSFQRL